ncbi:MAG: transcriptional repressor [Thaumarchaeota archaeon]|nr:transcriptional repressor [Candidatus Calditenuaceae archaeon]MDW8041256.1 Fur family transcriptional regulator [Nitrososphaerota archaeon]
MSRRRPPSSTEDLLSLLKSHGVKVTHQRLLVAEALMKLDHPTASEIYEFIASRAPAVGVATVYRTLRLFTKTGLTREISSMRGLSRYELYQRPHINLHCIACGHITDFDDSHTKGLFSVFTRRGFRVLGCDVAVLCPSCTARSRR